MKNLYLILDNGHGTRKYTAGKRSPDKRLYEGEWAREFVKKLSIHLDLRNIRWEILVPEDEDISLKERVRRANIIAARAKSHGYIPILISTHINAAASDNKFHDARGWTVWVSNNASNTSKEIAASFEKRAKEMDLEGNRYIPQTGYFTTNFYILKNTSCPAILCENLFMDNKDDLEFLLSEDGVYTLIKLYESSILNYINN